MSHTLEQKRATFALAAIEREKAKPNGREDYGRHVKKLPAMILNNGLGQALAFLLADGKEPSKELYKDVQEWLQGESDADHPRRIYAGSGELIKLLMGGNRSQYLQAQDETLKLLVWMKQFADAYLPKSGG